MLDWQIDRLIDSILMYDHHPEVVVISIPLLLGIFWNGHILLQDDHSGKKMCVYIYTIIEPHLMLRQLIIPTSCKSDFILFQIIASASFYSYNHNVTKTIREHGYVMFVLGLVTGRVWWDINGVIKSWWSVFKEASLVLIIHYNEIHYYRISNNSKYYIITIIY